MLNTFKDVSAQFVGSIFSWLFIRKISKEQSLPKDGFIAVANHASYLDIITIETVFLKSERRWVRFIAKKELLEDAHFRIFNRLWAKFDNKPILIDRSKKHASEDALSNAHKALKKGHIVGIFPEGGISLDGKLQEGKTGMVRLSILSQKPIVPIGIKGAYELMPRHRKFPAIRKVLYISIGKPIYLKQEKMTKRTLRKHTDLVMAKIASLSEQAFQT